MTPDDHKLWKQVTEGVLPLVFTPTAAAIRSHAGRGRMTRTFHTTLDLHGMTLDQAHAAVRRMVADAQHCGLKHVNIITGLSGPIRREFPFWVEQLSQVRRFETLNGGGAFKLHLVKKPSK